MPEGKMNDLVFKETTSASHRQIASRTIFAVSYQSPTTLYPTFIFYFLSSPLTAPHPPLFSFFIRKYCSAHPEELRDEIWLHYPEGFKIFGKRLQRDSKTQFSYVFVIPGIKRVSL